MKNAMCLTKLILVLCVAFSLAGCDKPKPVRHFTPAPKPQPAPTPADYVLKAIQLQLEYHNIFSESVYRASNRAKNRSSDFAGVVSTIGDVRSLPEAMAVYIRNLQSIDLSNCPADFQARFNAYVQSEINVLNLAAGVTHPDSLEDLIGGMINVGMTKDQVAQERDAAKAALYRLAEEKYGVQFVSK